MDGCGACADLVEATCARILSFEKESTNLQQILRHVLVNIYRQRCRLRMTGTMEDDARMEGWRYYSMKRHSKCWT
jgi:hypothetical protein